MALAARPIARTEPAARREKRSAAATASAGAIISNTIVKSRAEE
jgi:hypothetical protein